MQESTIPPGDKTELDRGMLLKLGLTKERMKDPLFFYQLLLPLCDTGHDDHKIDNDLRTPFYSKVEHYSIMYRAQLKIASPRTHCARPRLCSGTSAMTRCRALPAKGRWRSECWQTRSSR